MTSTNRVGRDDKVNEPAHIHHEALKDIERNASKLQIRIIRTKQGTQETGMFITN